MENIEWKEIEFVKVITSQLKPYTLGIFMDNMWHRVIYTGITEEGLWFIEDDREYLLRKEEIIKNKDNLRYKMVKENVCGSRYY